MKIKKLIIIFALLLVNYNSFPQSDLSILERIKIGDKVPAYELTNLINYPTNTAKFTDFKGKFLILDFWTFGCVSCVESWPKLMKLQNKFNNDMQIVTVNVHENAQKINVFLDRHAKIVGKRMNLPIATGDKNLLKLFPHQSVPHIVIIDKTGVVKYIAHSYDMNEEFLKNLVSGIKMQVPEKTDVYEKVNWSSPLYVDGNGGNEQKGGMIVYSSIIKEYSPRFSGTTEFSNKLSRSFGVIANASIEFIYRYLYGNGVTNYGVALPVSKGQFVFDCKDTSGLVSKVNGNLVLRNHYTIQVMAPKGVSIDNLKRRMISDIEQHFQLKSSWETQHKPCLVISKSMYPMNLYKKGIRMMNLESTFFRINNVSLKELIEGLLSDVFYQSPYPLVDETNFGGALGEISFDGNLRNIKELNDNLNKYGLKFSIQNRDVKVLVVRSMKNP